MHHPRSRYVYYPNASGLAPPHSVHHHHQQQQHHLAQVHHHHHQHRQHPAMSSTLLSSAEESNIFNYLDAFDWELDESVGAGMPPFDPSLPAAGPPMPVQHMDVDPYFADVQRPAQMHPFNAPHPQHQSSPLLPPPSPSAISAPIDPGIFALCARIIELKRPNSQATAHTAPETTEPHHVRTKATQRDSRGIRDARNASLPRRRAAAMASEFGYTGRPGRARGSGKNGKAKKMGKGKSGMLFRAVEFCKFLQQDVDALRAEVDRLEKEFAAQSLATPASSSSQPVT
ncbi:helix loop helix DNA-binding domain protein [Ceratobasidium sp. AG-Ba]|nr:helix loop helix DNA-binding domain protein [Ceratobasidium sp. AG-Ba]